jgi:hypothetical protein
MRRVTSAPRLPIHFARRCWRRHKAGGDHRAAERNNHKQSSSSYDFGAFSGLSFPRVGRDFASCQWSEPLCSRLRPMNVRDFADPSRGWNAAACASFQAGGVFMRKAYGTRAPPALVRNSVSILTEQAPSHSITGPSRHLSVTESCSCSRPTRSHPMPTRKKQTIPLTTRLAQLAEEARRRAEAAPLGAKRETLLKAARISETALQLQQWISSPGLRAPS